MAKLSEPMGQPAIACTEIKYFYRMSRQKTKQALKALTPNIPALHIRIAIGNKRE
jgi:hypothetical protein